MNILHRFFRRHPRLINRPLEIVPGAFSWSLLTAPFWASFIWPHYIAYFVLFFDVYWLYKSMSFAYYFTNGFIRLRAQETIDWRKAAEDLPHWKNIHHVIIIPTFKEPLHTLSRTLKALTDQQIQKTQLSVVLATEARETDAPAKTALLREEFKNAFANLWVTVHPDIPGEVKGKSSNMAWAAKWAKQKLVDGLGMNMDNITVTSCDADSRIHPKYFASLTYHFLKDPLRFFHFWQAPVVYYANIWKVPLPVRIVATFSSTWSIAKAMREDKQINYSTYSLSLRLAHDADYWSVDVIPEDYHLFLKVFFRLGEKVAVKSIFLPVYADAAQAQDYWSTMKNQYRQLQRWAWGVTDDPYAIKRFFLRADIPFLPRFMRTVRLLEDHFLWPVNWFILTIGAVIPPLINPLFADTIIGYNLPRFAWWIITSTSAFFVIVLVLDSFIRPPRPASVGIHKLPLLYLQWLTLPIVGFFFSALPAIDAHTRLMLGKYLEYRVTEKV